MRKGREMRNDYIQKNKNSFFLLTILILVLEYNAFAQKCGWRVENFQVKVGIIPANQEAEIWRISVQSISGKKLASQPATKAHTYDHSYEGGHR
jgi:hypothetical protein